MAGGDSTQQSLRKVLGALKDSTTVGLAKVNSYYYKDLDVAIIKATNHVEELAKQKHIRTIFDAVSATRPRADVAYCINALAKRLAKTHNWAVAIKILIVIHRALREVDPSFREELINYTKSSGHMLNLSHFKDGSSLNAWDYSAWVRTYALYLEERLECFRVLKYDIETERRRTSELDTIDLLEHLPALQQLLFRLISCQPEGAAVYNNVVRYALSIVAGESVNIYNAINDGTLNVVDKFFEMQRHDALRSLEIYRKAGYQAELLSEFYETCKGLDLRPGQEFVKVEQPPASFISAMEEYVKDASRSLTLQRHMADADLEIAHQPILAIEQKKENDDQERPNSEAASVPHEPPTVEPPPAEALVTDLLSLDDFGKCADALEEKNAFALAIVTDGNSTNAMVASDLASDTSGWELALVGAASSTESSAIEVKLACEIDQLTLDSLYDDAIARSANQNGSYHMGQVAPNPFETLPYPQDPFYASNSVAPSANVQMSAMAKQQSLIMQQQQQQPMGLEGSNPFGNPFAGQEAGLQSYLNHSPQTGFM
ncbi:putative clathrin assembly protein At5g35200 isoform X2 [Dioscorea cayenensis subsp. rotundata]|uniref:Clathrin assembly protein At5g35200 isoform X2 n=1 Tax=Dioscorea cayennensis subsp. rotundata TaxID=55577 RepID=A0AB40CMW1_DIOCR|nr:putative clathrin assembly protein At5g35200 isoform X2 [Dioscorea cayenensis subsp. rotundata]